MRLVVLRAAWFVCLVPGGAFAQATPQESPPAAADPAAPADPAVPAPAAAPPTAAPASTGYYTPAAPPPAPPPGGYYAPPGQPMYGPPPAPRSLHNGMTFEANLGLGWIHLSNDNNSDTSDLGLGGLSLGVGGWLNPKLALTGRIAGVTLSENGAQLTHAFFGPSLQYWVDDHFWLGGGAGLSVLAASNDSDSDSITGFGLDLRIGYTFTAGSENTLNVSFELNPGWYSENGDSATLTGIGILLGYQHL